MSFFKKKNNFTENAKYELSEPSNLIKIMVWIVWCEEVCCAAGRITITNTRTNWGLTNRYLFMRESISIRGWVTERVGIDIGTKEENVILSGLNLPLSCEQQCLVNLIKLRWQDYVSFSLLLIDDPAVDIYVRHKYLAWCCIMRKKWVYFEEEHDKLRS